MSSPLLQLRQRRPSLPGPEFQKKRGILRSAGGNEAVHTNPKRQRGRDLATRRRCAIVAKNDREVRCFVAADLEGLACDNIYRGKPLDAGDSTSMILAVGRDRSMTIGCGESIDWTCPARSRASIRK